MACPPGASPQKGLAQVVPEAADPRSASPATPGDAPVSLPPAPPSVQVDAPLPRGGVLTFCGITVLNHVAQTGSRVAVTLAALAWGMSAFQVGMLSALYALLPMLLSITAGRWVDRTGVQQPSRIGTYLIIAGVAAPAIYPAWQTLAFASCAIGVGFMLQQLAAQALIGRGATTDQRTTYFAWMALGLAVSGFAGPLMAGFAIDAMGHRAALVTMIVTPLFALWWLREQPYRLPRPAANASTATARKGPRFDLLRDRLLRRCIWANLLLAGAWDFHAFAIPVYGTYLGLSATTIGLILACFGSAIFVIRVILPLIRGRIPPWTLVRASTWIAAAVYLALPFADQVPMLMVLSFILGLAVGSCQPSMLALMYQYAPPGRATEALGLRMAVVLGSQVGMPLLFGALATGVGVAPLFGAMGVLLVVGALQRPPVVPADRLLER